MAEICLRTVTGNCFKKHEKQVFEVDIGGSKAPFVLYSVDMLPPRKNFPEGLRAEPFSLVFHGPDGVLVPQGNYRIANPDMGEATLMMVPLGPAEAGNASGAYAYQALFG